jgi:hypothetical protein
LDRETPDFVPHHFALTGTQSAAHFEAERSSFVTNTARTATRPGQPKQAVAGAPRTHLPKDLQAPLPTGREACLCFASLLVTMALVRSGTLDLLCIGTLEKQTRRGT